MLKKTLWKIKPGKREILEAWHKELMTTHKEEALITLGEEDLVREACFIFGKGDESYLYYIHQTVDGKEKKKANLARQLNVKHFEVMRECLEFIDDTPVSGYDLRIE